MRCAFFLISPNGGKWIEKIQAANLEAISSIDVFIKEGKPISLSSVGIKNYRLLTDIVATAFLRYDALIFIGAVSIAVRMIAPHLKSKLTDPAVIAIDDKAKYAVSVLSGHVGGANALTFQIATALEAIPVITTATDTNDIIAPDSIATDLGLYPSPKPLIEKINAALLTGKPPEYIIDEDFPRAAFFEKKLKERGIEPRLIKAGRSTDCAAGNLAVLITPQELLPQENILYLKPRRLVAGIGCRRGTTEEDIRIALADACNRIGQDIEAVSLIASTIVKSDEAGLLALAKNLGTEIKFFTNEELQAKITEYDLEESDFVKKQIGVGNVAAAAALCGVEKGRFALDKTKYKKVTVALVWEK